MVQQNVSAYVLGWGVEGESSSFWKYMHVAADDGFFLDRYSVFICIITFVIAMQEQHITFAKQKLKKKTNKQIINVKADNKGEYHKKKEIRTSTERSFVCLSFVYEI